MSKLFTRFAGWCAWAFGHPLAFILACLATLAWAVTGPVFNYSDTWQLVINTGTTVATFLMIFVLQHSQNRDATAIQAKLDELILASEASNRLIRAEQLTEEEVEELRCDPRHHSPQALANGVIVKLDGRVLRGPSAVRAEFRSRAAQASLLHEVVGSLKLMDCARCGERIIEIDRHGERLIGCLECNCWSSSRTAFTVECPRQSRPHQATLH